MSIRYRGRQATETVTGAKPWHPHQGNTAEHHTDRFGIGFEPSAPPSQTRSFSPLFMNQLPSALDPKAGITLGKVIDLLLDAICVVDARGR